MAKQKKIYNLCRLLMIFTALSAIAGCTRAQNKNERPKNTILIGWDAAARDHVYRDLNQGGLPNLKQLASEGALVPIDVIRVTDTKAGWAQILTGYEPETDGVYNNRHWQPIPKGYSIFERLENFFGPDNFVTVAVISKRENLGAEALTLKPITEEMPDKKWQGAGDITFYQGKKYQVGPPEPYFYTKDALDVFINGLGPDGKVGSTALTLLEKYKDKPFFFFVHFGDVDRAGHQYGEGSKEYDDALTSIDIWLGKIVQKLKKLNIYDQTLIYVTSDHGFDKGQKAHNDAPYVFLATNDRKVMRAGKREDIAPTILSRFGLDLSNIQPPLSGHTLTGPYEEPKK